MRAPALALLVCLAACADFPQLDAVVPQADRDAPYPALVPLAPLLAQAQASGRITPQSEAEAAARAAGLRDRTAGLRGPVVDAATRDRMAAAARRAALR